MMPFSAPPRPIASSSSPVTTPAPSAAVPRAASSAGAGRPATKLQPKEHGAYAILGVPLVTSLLMAGITLPGVCIAIASIAGFLAHEPLLVAWGHRGARAQRNSPTANRQLVIALATMILAGVIALGVGTMAVRVALLGCAGVALACFLFASIGRHRTLVGELGGVLGLTAPGVPILLAGGLSFSAALAVWSTWLIGFAATIFTVRGVVAAQKRRSLSVHIVGYFFLLSLTFALVMSRHPLAITLLPMLALSGYLLWRPPPAKYLKRIGWTSLMATTATAVWMLLLWRA